MRDGAEEDRRQGPFAVLALLLSLLLAYSPAAAIAGEPRGGASGLAEPGLTKSTASLRSVARGQTDDQDCDAAGRTGAPAAVSATRSLYLSSASSAPQPLPALAPAILPYRARAPPAA